MLDLGRVEIEKERFERMVQDIQKERFIRSVLAATQADRHSVVSRLLASVGRSLTVAGAYLQERYGVINEQATNACNVNAFKIVPEK